MKTNKYIIENLINSQNKKNGSQHRTKLIALFRLTYESPRRLSWLVII